MPEKINCVHNKYFKGSYFYICVDCGSDFLTSEEASILRRN